MTDVLQQGLDRVYAAQRDDFVAERNALVKQLREQGDTEQADQVAKLRKPTLAAWALNGLARAEPEMADQLLDLQSRLESADSAESMREASERRQSVVEQLTGTAVGILDDAGHAGAQWRDRIELSLLALGTNAEAARVFRLGRLSQEVEPGSNWSHALVAAGVDASGDQDDAAADRRQLERARQELQRLQDKATKLQQRSEQAARRKEESVREAKAAAKAAKQAQAEADRQEKEVAQAEHRLT